MINNIKKKLGFDCFYEKSANGQFYTYCGSFKDKEVAEKRVTQLKSKGFNAFIKAVS